MRLTIHRSQEKSSPTAGGVPPFFQGISKSHCWLSGKIGGEKAHGEPLEAAVSSMLTQRGQAMAEQGMALKLV